MSVETVDRTVYLGGDVDEDMAQEAMVALHKLESESSGEIVVVICSDGGDEQSGYAIYDALLRCRSRVVTKAYGAAHSIAAVILQAGDLRQISPNSTFMIHNGVESKFHKEPDQNYVIEVAERIVRMNKRYYAILSAASQQPLDTIEAWCREETFFLAHEAVEHGFADEVIQPLKVKYEAVETPTEEEK